MTEPADNWHRVVARSDIPDPGAHGFQIQTDAMPVFGFIVHRQGQVYGYENVCPHAGRMLNHGPHRFLTPDNSLIVCAAHGAVFDIGSGECAAGPCMGESLRPMALRETDGMIEVDLSGVAWL
ncbi:MAG: Rieske (2Fe-2S) protein [Gammaproteobacteria bacterium]